MENSKSRKKIKPTEKEIKRAEELKRLRLKHGLSLDEVAQKLNISKVTLSRYENTDITNIPMGNIEQLAKIYKTTPAHLMGWEEKKEIYLISFYLYFFYWGLRIILILIRYLRCLLYYRLQPVIT